MFKRMVFLSIVLCLVLAGSVSADTSWDGSESSDWSNADNWNAGVPDGADVVTIGAGGFVADLREEGLDEIIGLVDHAFQRRQ